MSSRPPILNSLSFLKERILDAGTALPNGATGYFVPANEFKRLITIESVSTELLSHGNLDSKYPDVSELAERIVQKAPKLFAILVCQDLCHYILDLLEAGLNDEDLSFTHFSLSETYLSGMMLSRHKSAVSKVKRGFKISSKRSPREPLQCMYSWNWRDLTALIQGQWGFISLEADLPDDPTKQMRHRKSSDCLADKHDSDTENITSHQNSISKLSSHPLESALATGLPELVRCLLTEDFDAIAQDDFVWLSELREYGYSVDEIAHLLMDERINSPWILLERRHLNPRLVEQEEELQNIIKYMGNLTDAIGYAQKHGICCDSFTCLFILRDQVETQVIELCCIRFPGILDLAWALRRLS
jgi:hypothetical protein